MSVDLCHTLNPYANCTAHWLSGAHRIENPISWTFTSSHRYCFIPSSSTPPKVFYTIECNHFLFLACAILRNMHFTVSVFIVVLVVYYLTCNISYSCILYIPSFYTTKTQKSPSIYDSFVRLFAILCFAKFIRCEWNLDDIGLFCYLLLLHIPKWVQWIFDAPPSALHAIGAYYVMMCIRLIIQSIADGMANEQRCVCATIFPSPSCIDAWSSGAFSRLTDRLFAHRIASTWAYFSLSLSIDTTVREWKIIRNFSALTMELILRNNLFTVEIRSKYSL